MNYDADVIVCGAGIAGLGLANALARYDLKVLLLEKRKRTGGIHRGDSLLPKVTRLFDRWGVLGAIRQAGAQPVERLEIHHHRLGKLSDAPILPADETHPYLVLPHAKIEQVLLGEALARGRTTLLRPARVTEAIREDGRIVGVRYVTRDGVGEARAKLVVAADGHRSVIRQALGIEAVAHRYDHGYLGLEADRPKGYRNTMRLHLHQDGGVLVMPRVDRVGVGVLVEPGSSARWLAMSDAELSKTLAKRAPILRHVKLHRKGSHVYDLVKVHVPRYQQDGAVLIGDAAHCTNPVAGQGMSLALTDAGCLAETVAPALLDGATDLSEALARYEAEQWPLNDRIVQSTHPLARFYALRGPGWDLLKAGLVWALANPVGDRLGRPLRRTFMQDPRPALTSA